jgi:TonB family protein
MAPIERVNNRDQHSLSQTESNEQPLFVAYEVRPQQGKNRFVLSTALHAAALVILVQLPGWISSPQVEPVAVARVTPLVAPALVKKVVLPPPKMVAKVETPKVIVAPPPPKQVEVVKVTPSKIQPKTEIAAVTPDIKAVPAKKEILTTTYASGSSAPPTLQKPPREVQTGGFGDPMGVRGTSDKGALRQAALGSFELPTGPGTGNGTGGSRGAKGTVASSGFGNGTAGSGSGDRGRRGQIAQAGQTGFDQVAAPTVQKSRPPVTAALTPVEILYKPKPVYTDEARRLHVEGEVLMEVTFSANGRLQDMRVVRGLGHGLDEAAQRAAAQIKFRPAKRDGQPLDSTAFVHIVFELAE